MFWPFWSLLSPSSLLLEEHEEEEDTSVSEVKEFSSLENWTLQNGSSLECTILPRGRCWISLAVTCPGGASRLVVLFPHQGNIHLNHLKPDMSNTKSAQAASPAPRLPSSPHPAFPGLRPLSVCWQALSRLQPFSEENPLPNPLNASV